MSEEIHPDIIRQIVEDVALSFHAACSKVDASGLEALLALAELFYKTREFMVVLSPIGEEEAREALAEELSEVETSVVEFMSTIKELIEDEDSIEEKSDNIEMFAKRVLH